jgi:hypothetical protein
MDVKEQFTEYKVITEKEIKVLNEKLSRNVNIIQQKNKTITQLNNQIKKHEKELQIKIEKLVDEKIQRHEARLNKEYHEKIDVNEKEVKEKLKKSDEKYKGLCNVLLYEQKRRQKQLEEYENSLKLQQTQLEDYKSLLELSEDFCCVCYSQPRQKVFVPCGHIAVCASCVLNTKTCPVCRGMITKSYNFYFS